MEEKLDIILDHDQLLWGNKKISPCSWGRGGIKASKKEGDGATPVGIFPFRRVFYRADRLEIPDTLLPLQPLTPQDGWCDDVTDACYNQHVSLPYKGRHEKLWREDHVYDLLLVIGHNDNPIRRGDGSAIFIHLLRSEGAATEGCVALKCQDLLEILRESTHKSSLIVIA